MPRSIWLPAGLVVALAATGIFLAPPPLKSHPLSAGASAEAVTDKEGIFKVATTRKMVALTFDDGPNPQWTPTVLKILTAHRVRATFFVIGSQVMAYPDLLKQEIRDGHTIGDHTFHHPHLDRLSSEGARREISRGAAAIQEISGVSPHLFRPPYGGSDGYVEEIASHSRLKTIFWNLSLEHFAYHEKEPIAVEDILSRIEPGTIILAHDGGKSNRTRTLEALPQLLDGLSRKGYEVTDVDTLLKSGIPLNHR